MDITTHNFTLSDTGFVGCAYIPENISDTAVIAITGSDGGLKRVQYLAMLFADRGIPALALAYFRHPGLSDTLRLIPLEYIQRAAYWLRDNTSAKKISLYSISKGAEYALSAASRFPIFDSIVAVVPNYYVAEGFTKRFFCAGDSSWSYQGKPLPYLHLSGNIGKLITTSIKEKQLSIKTFYEISERKGVPADAIIPVEKSNARILLLSSGQDSMWFSKQASEKIVEGLKKNHYPHDYKHVCFEISSHILHPVPEGLEKRYRKTMRVERLHPDKCSTARLEAFELAVEWIS